MTNKTAEDNADTREVKDAARRLQEYLGTQGISLKQAQALEALSASLSLPNWQTLRAKLTAPAAATSVAVDGYKEGDPRWMVTAIYTDNNQRYCDDFGGDSPLEAQILCQMDRKADYCEVEIAAVVDRKTGKIADCESDAGETCLLRTSEAVQKLCALAAPHLGEAPKSGIAECEAYDRKMRALDFWTSICGAEEPNEIDKQLRRELDDIAPDEKYPGDPLVFTDSRGVEGPLDTVEALTLLLEMASTKLDLAKPDGEPKKSGVFQCLQVRAFIEYFEDQLSQVFNDWEVEV